MNELDRYAVSLENMEVLRAQVEEQAREIERLEGDLESANDWDISQLKVIHALNEELAALKAQPSGVVRWPEADEIMQMAFEEGQPGEDASGYYFELEEFDLFIQRWMRRAAFEAWYLGHFYMGDKHCGLEWLSTEPCGGYRHQHPAEQWIVWQARAALSANHSEQVRNIVPDGWRIRECEDVDADIKGLIISSPIIDGQRSSNSVWPTDADPAHRLLYEILTASPSAGSQKEQGE